MGQLPHFKIESVTFIKGHGTIVFARNLSGVEFEIQAGLLLGGAKIESADMPRKLNEDGSPSLDMWAFKLGANEDASSFTEGQIVALSQ